MSEQSNMMWPLLMMAWTLLWWIKSRRNLEEGT